MRWHAGVEGGGWGGVYTIDTLRESALEVDFGRKIPCQTGNQTCVRGVQVRCSNKLLTYIPTP